MKISNTRRKIAGSMFSTLVIGALNPSRVFAQFSDFNIRIIREIVPYTGAIDPNRCVYGKLWFSSDSMPNGIGAASIRTLELPDRNNMNSISFIPQGEYSAYIRDDGPLGWRIELENVPGRGNIQIHIGNFPEQILGCILVGTSIDTNVVTRIKVRNADNGVETIIAQTCSVVSSAAALQLLKDGYADPSYARRIVVNIS